MGISTGGRMEHVPRFWSRGRDAYTNAHGPQPSQLFGLIFLLYGIFLSHFLKKIDRYARWIALYKISVPEIIEIWACNVKTAQNYIYLIMLLRYYILIKITKEETI